MSTAAPLQALATKPQPLSSLPAAGLLLQRKCACGSPTSSLTGECAECKSKKRLQTKLTIGASNDPLEQEADRVAEQVIGSGTPAVSSVAAGRLQREDAPKEKSNEEKYQEGLAKLGEAFLQTPLGKELQQKIKQDALVKGATEFGKEFISTWPGKIVTGAAATGAVAALAATHKELPAQLPAIPLDRLVPGLSVRLTYKGPVDKPTEAMITFNFSEQAPKSSADKKPLSEADKFRAETARMAAENAKFQASMTYAPGSPEDLQQKAEQEAIRKAAMKYSGGPDIGATIKKYPWLATPQPKSGLQLTMPKPSFGVQTPSLTGECVECESKKLLQPKLTIGASNDPLELEADRVADQVISAPTNSPVNGVPPRIQRYTAQPSAAPGVAPASVDRVLASPGRPLEPTLRQDMEQRFGHDFSQVRVHDDAEADRSARDVGAHAYTVGQDLVFATGQYRSHTDAGRRLLAHELTHTLQQSGSVAPAVQRSACGHDGQKTNCRAELGVLKLRDAAGSIGQLISIDRWIADDGLRVHFGGQWAAQVQTPPNPLKSGEDRGSADAIRVSDDGSLALEVVEIKARSAAGGGCTLATAEARGYANVLTLIKPQVLAISAGLARQGGVRVASGKCRGPKAEERKKLEAAGVDFGNETSMQAWCFISSLQERLNKTYSQAFSGMKVGLFGGGMANTTYPVWPPMRITCPKGKGKSKSRLGWTFLGFQVNQKGGVSYGCRDQCFDSEEDEKRRTQELVKEDQMRKEKDKQTAPQQTVPSEMYLDNPAQEDIDEDQPPVNLPEGGISVTEALVIGGGALITVATLHQAAKALTGAEREAARAAARAALAQARARGALDVARKLNSTRLAKQFGTQAYDKTVTGVATSLEKQALKDAGFLAKHGAKGAKFLGRAAGILGVLMLAKDAAAAVSHISKGGTIDIGLQGMDASLEGSTDINTKGPAGKQDVLGDVKLKDTQIDIETKGFPSISGNVNLDADKLTVRGRVGDGDAKVNFTAKYKNTTITITRDGQVKGGKLTMQRGTDLSDAEIEIDLPPEADLSKRNDAETPLVVKGGKIKITEVGQGGGGAGQAGKAGAPDGGGGTATDDKTSDKPAGKTAETKPPVQLPEPPGQGGAGGQAGSGKAGAPTDDLVELVREVQGSTGLRTLYGGLLGKDDGVPVTAEMLRRLVAQKASIERHPAVVNEIIAALKPGEIKDAIKQIIEPIEERMRQADQKLVKAREKSIEEALAKGVPPDPTKPPPAQKPAAQQPDADKDKDKPKDPGKDKDSPKKGGGEGTGIDLSAVRELRLVDLLPLLERPAQAGSEKSPPQTMNYVIVWRLGAAGSELVYYIPCDMTLKQRLAAAKGEIWRAAYTFTPPTGVILSAQGDMPIRFTDTGVITAHIVQSNSTKQ